MSNKEYLICEKSDLIAVADAIREKTGSTEGLAVSELADAVSEIGAGGSGIAMPEMCTVNWMINFSEFIANGTVGINYIGINETNTVKSLNANGISGTFQCVSKGFIEIYSNLTTNQFGEDCYPCVNIRDDQENYYNLYIGGEGGDHSIIAVQIFEDCNLIITLD